VGRGRAGRRRDEQKLFHAKILEMDLRLGHEAGPKGARGGGAAGGAAAAAAAAQSSFASHDEYVAALAPLVLEELRAELLAARGEAAEGAGGGWVEARVADVPAAEADFQYLALHVLARERAGAGAGAGAGSGGGAAEPRVSVHDLLVVSVESERWARGENGSKESERWARGGPGPGGQGGRWGAAEPLWEFACVVVPPPPPSTLPPTACPTGA